VRVRGAAPHPALRADLSRKRGARLKLRGWAKALLGAVPTTLLKLEWWTRFLLMRAALACHAGMATFAETGVSSAGGGMKPCRPFGVILPEYPA